MPFIKARGVDSVRSPIGNVAIDITDRRAVWLAFKKELIRVFTKAHGIKGTPFPEAREGDPSFESEDLATGYVGLPWYNIQEIRQSEEELKVGQL